MNIIQSALIGAIFIVSMFGAVQYIDKKSLQSDKENLTEAVAHYEAMIKVIPYNTLAKERKDNANSEINSTLSSDDVISDGTFRL